jgi:hypothetical protein
MSEFASIPGLASALGLGAELSEEAGALQDQMSNIVSAVEDAADVLSPLGWPPLEQSNTDAYKNAADLTRSGKEQEAIDLIVDSWNENDALMLRQSVQRVQGLYSISGTEYPRLGRPDVGHQRAVLIMEAHENHLEGRYASAISLVFSQVDGITADFSDEGYAFFSRIRGKAEPRATLTDDSTFAGHPQALKAIAVSLTEQCKTTETKGRLLRHGIIHGRELGYGTKENSTKALVTLLALITFVEKKAKLGLLTAVRQHEQDVTGLTGYDEDGRWKDRRGFRAAKKSLRLVELRQERYREDHGTYAGDIRQLNPNEAIEELRDVNLCSRDDGDTYWAWVTPHAFTLGLGRHHGDIDTWKYGAPKAPDRLPNVP